MMRRFWFKPWIWLGLCLLAICQACTKESTIQAPGVIPTRSSGETTLAARSTPTSSPQEDPLRVSSLSELHNAVVQIEVAGTFIDPLIGESVNTGKLGSGIIIDSQGIVVTNNHLVTGATYVRVWVGGDTRKTYPAVVLGVSECSDLAVIDIDGEGFSYVEWFDGEIQIGQDVFTAGYPMGNRQFILSDGVIVNSTASGETRWSSIETVLEHTAIIGSMNTGGALVDGHGRLIGVNYAIDTHSDQGLAIGREETMKVIDFLRQGKHVGSIGINGTAVSGTVNNVPISGQWVRSVDTDSPAGKAGIHPGDIVYMIEDELLAKDGTMTEYCTVLRKYNASDSMAVTIIRWEDLSVWEGQLNGDSLALTGNYTKISSERAGSGSASTVPNCEPSDLSGFLSCTDDSHALIIDIPEEWLDFDGRKWVYNGRVVGVAISASTDLEVYAWNKKLPGMFFGASNTFAQWGGYIEFLDIYTPWYHEACEFEGRKDYDDGLYKGKVDYFSNCDGVAGANAYVLAAVPINAPASAMIIISVQLPEGQEDILEHIWNSFYLGDM